jgi:hypothetical protein
VALISTESEHSSTSNLLLRACVTSPVAPLHQNQTATTLADRGVPTKPTDIRKSFDGLSGAVREILSEGPFSGHLFIFRNKRGDMLKLIWWSRGGFSSRSEIFRL